MLASSCHPSSAFSRAGDELGLARLPWPNVGTGDALELDDGRVRVVDVVPTPPGSVVDALVKAAFRRRQSASRAGDLLG